MPGNQSQGFVEKDDKIKERSETEIKRGVPTGTRPSLAKLPTCKKKKPVKFSAAKRQQQQCQSCYDYDSRVLGFTQS